MGKSFIFQLTVNGNNGVIGLLVKIAKQHQGQGQLKEKQSLEDSHAAEMLKRKTIALA